MAMTNRLSKNDGAILASLALAAHYFPASDVGDAVRARFSHAAFLIGGHYDTWAAWRTMPHQERQRIAAVLGFAPEELCKVGKYSRRARKLLTVGADGSATHPFLLYGNAPERADAAVPRVGGDLLGYVDRILERLRKAHRRRQPQEIASEGTWLTRSWYSPGIGLVQGKVTIPDFGEQPIPEVSLNVATVPYCAEVTIDTGDLLDVAGDIDKRYPAGDRYVQRVLGDLFRQMDTTDTVKVTEVVRLMAGPMEILNAPTGTGKSVFVRVAASWFALNDMAITLVLPTVDATLSAAWDIHEDLQHLRTLRSIPRELGCTPLMSPYGLHERALKAGTRVEGAFLDQQAKSRWRIDQLAYGCALGPLTEISTSFPPGSESCRTLMPLPPKRGNHVCPWMTTTCGKFEQPRRAINASVIVTNHHNFMVGRFPLPVVLDGHRVDDVTIAEFVFRRSHAVLIDEVDQFQSTALGMCASELVLDTRRNHAVPLRDLDDDKARLPIEAAKDLCPTISHARYLSEFLLAGICTNDIHLRQYEGGGPARDQQGLNTTGWHLAGGRDRRLIMLLFPDAGITNEQDVPNELFGLLNALGPTHPGADDEYATDEPMELPPHLRAVRTSLEKILAPPG